MKPGSSRWMRWLVVVGTCAVAAGCSANPEGPPNAQPRPGSNSTSESPTPSPQEDDGRFVRLPTSGGSIRGSLFGRGRIGVVLSPQLAQARWDWFPLARVLAESGYQALSIDSNDEDLDGEIVDASAFLRKRGADEVFAIGASKGGTAVLGAATRERDLAGVIAVSPVLSFGDVTLKRRNVATFEVPALVIVDEEDGSIMDVETLDEWGRDSLQVQILNADGAHGTEYLASRQRPAFIRSILRFIAAHKNDA